MNPADVLKYGDQFLRRTLEGVPQSAWETGGVCGVWSVKEIIAHLAVYEGWLTEILAPFAGVKVDTPNFTRIGEIGPAAWNDVSVDERKGKSPADALAEYTAAYQYNYDQLVPKVDAAVWARPGTLPWYGAEYALDDFIVYSFYGHKREHAAQIAVYKDSL